MLDRELWISIPGHPKPKGSMKCVGRRGKVAHALVEQIDNEDWRTCVAHWCKRNLPKDQHAAPGQPVGVEITFTLPRPKGHYGTGRNAHQLKDRFAGDLPVGHGTGDTDKLLRLVLDALQDAGILPNDSAVIETVARKTYVDGPELVPDSLAYPGVFIRIFPYDPAGAPT